MLIKDPARGQLYNCAINEETIRIVFVGPMDTEGAREGAPRQKEGQKTGGL